MQNKITKPSSAALTVGTVFLCLLLLLAACVKDDTTPQSPTTPASSANFSWTTNGSTVTADSAICYLQITTIYAYKNGLSQTIELNLSDITTNTYPVNAASGNEIKYVNGSTNKAVSTGTVQLTNTGGSKLSGSFSGDFPSGGGSITGQFSNVSFR